MSRITEQQVKQRMHDLSDGSPDYDEMWSRIQLEVKRRRSGWSEQPNVPATKRGMSRARRWAIAASAAAVLATAGGAAVYFNPLMQQEIAPTEMGQQIGIATEVEGVEVTLDSVVVGRKPSEQDNQIALHLSLTDVQNRGFNTFEFESMTLTDLDTGESLPMQSDRSLFQPDEANPSIQTLIQYFASNLSADSQNKKYRLTLNNLTYSTTQIVDTIQKEWTLDFTIKNGETVTFGYDLPIENQTAFEQRTGMKLEPAEIGPFELRIPLTRTQQTASDGFKLLYYEDVSLRVDDKEVKGRWNPWPTTANLLANVGPDSPEALYFNFVDYGLEDVRDRSLTLQLRNAAVVHEYPDLWTKVSPPTDQAQRLQQPMPDQYVMDYKVTREGKDIHVQTLTKNKFTMVSGTKLKVDGKLYESDPHQASNKYVGDFGYQIDVFPNVPEGSEFSINAGTYRVQDASRDVDIPIPN
ncbi:hypothetical protein [Saccharibacillus sacchari]|uniref:Uncharacterized protein n=1 Tax=Saccharibacillus sacchari TaxID=456493 RepID=A0ACC6PI15_9BACL